MKNAWRISLNWWNASIWRSKSWRGLDTLKSIKALGRNGFETFEWKFLSIVLILCYDKIFSVRLLEKPQKWEFSRDLKAKPPYDNFMQASKEPCPLALCVASPRLFAPFANSRRSNIVRWRCTARWQITIYPPEANAEGVLLIAFPPIKGGELIFQW